MVALTIWFVLEGRKIMYDRSNNKLMGTVDMGGIAVSKETMMVLIHVGFVLDSIKYKG